jgi:hypothetical protein
LAGAAWAETASTAATKREIANAEVASTAAAKREIANAEVAAPGPPGPRLPA